MATNKYGLTPGKVIENDLDFASSCLNKKVRHEVAVKAIGAADIAVDFGLVTYDEWNDLVHKAFKLL